MRRIAIIGSGIAGLVAAHGLRRAGHEVTLYSDRSPEQWLDESRPTGTAGRFPTALEYEAELGLNYWDDVAPRGEGVFLTFCPTAHNRLIRLYGRGRFQAIDVRLQSARWMRELEARGGRVVIESIGINRLEQIAAAHELTLVAAGRAELARLFERDSRRSVYDAPRRHLTMIAAAGRMSVDDCPFLPVKFDFLGTDGELFFVPWLHKDRGPVWNILFEAKPGSRMDRFGEAKSGEEALAIAKNVVRELFPWNAEWLQEMELADPNGWLVGRVTPLVRRPVGTLPSGRIVAALGDTAISYDPIAAQGANSCVKQARHLVASVVARGALPFDAQWITETFDDYYTSQAQYACLFSNLFLEEITMGAKELLIAQYGSDGRLGNTSGRQRIADRFFAAFNEPRLMTEPFTDVARARALIASLTGHSWVRSAVRGRAAIARDQLSQRLRRLAAVSARPHGAHAARA
ncbi:MAG TPA: styrene monooxygenase/indole monooxygenase family protein [Thermoanaerobaculia bacterium]